MVDVLGAVVGMESLDDDGEGVDEVFEPGQQEQLRQEVDGADELKLGDPVDQVDGVEPLGTVEIAPVDGIDPQEAGLAVGAGLAALADLDRTGPGLGERPGQGGVEGVDLGQRADIGLGVAAPERLGRSAGSVGLATGQ